MSVNTFKNSAACFLADKFRRIKAGYFGKERFELLFLAYHILPLLGFDYCRLVEWKFILKRLPRKKDCRLLDVGCTSSLFIHKLTRFGAVYGIDVRPFFENLPKNIRFRVCDVAKLPFEDNYFDVITLISVIEHVGLGSYGDVRNSTGDLAAMQELKRVLAARGSIFLTTLIGNKEITRQDNSERFYDQQRLKNLIGDFFVKAQEYYIFRKKWVKVDKSKAFEEAVPERFGIACLHLIKQ